jgi:hypothetical protein
MAICINCKKSNDHCQAEAHIDKLARTQFIVYSLTGEARAAEWAKGST